MWLVYGRLFSFVSWEAVGDGLAMLVGSVLGKLRGASRLQESGLADLALDVHSLDIRLQLRLGNFGILRVALALLLGLGSVTHFC